MKEDKSNQIIKQRIFWTDYSVNIVLDTLYLLYSNLNSGGI